ncbi:PAS domain S-box protein [Domibacillus robiginosus]|uniref:PAS domain S-box protein n=1 Tax=Domibacillus robiginosus TaxID=1071054 RepID=UPI00067E1478|nr:PAS domain S-box protein [Domibacillus robiginosus]
MNEKTISLHTPHPEIYSHLLNQTSDVAMVLFVENDTSFRFTFINDRAVELFGWQCEEICGMLLNEVWPGDTLDIILNRCVKALTNQNSLLFQETICLAQNIVAGRMSFSPLFNKENKCNHILIVIQDIKKQITQSNHLELEYSFFEAFFSQSVDPISLWNVKGDLLKVNPAFEKVFGWGKEEFKRYITLQASGFVPADKKEEAIDFFQQMLQGKTVSHYQTQRQHKDGRLLDVAITYLPIKNKEGKVTAGAISFYDISETKKLERELREIKEQLELVWENTADAIDVFTLEGRLLHINPAFTSLFGWTKEDTKGEKPAIIFTPPHLKKELQQMRGQLRRGQSIVGLETLRQKKDGRMLEVLATYNPLKNESGEVWAVIGVYKDISKLKQVQAELRDSEERYRLIAEHSYDMIKVIDSNGIITYASPSHQKILGFKPDELIGKRLFDTIHKKDVEQIKQQFAVSSIEKRVCQIQFRQYLKNGSWIWVEVTVTPLCSKEGYVQHYTVAARDITQKKQDEEELRNYASFDSLTGLYNRRIFTELIDKAIIDSRSSGRTFAVMYMDIDKFKTINDSHGHEIGDELLKQFAKRLKAATRKSDVLARMGGDEFTIILSDICSFKEVIEAAERIQQKLRFPYWIQGHTFSATSSSGIAFYPDHGEDMQTLLRHADRALYKAKENRNMYCLYK